MTFIEGTLLSKHLGDSTIQSSSLHPNVSDSDIQSAYRVMAQVILELSKPTFSAIGALAEGSRAWKVDQSPLILNMNELVRVGNLPPGHFCREDIHYRGRIFRGTR
ncbi:hypothetical protein AlacWU_09890 [Aspergillus niger]|nr:hypothetical protein AlacWU_09890 [Aspergillus niger]